MAKEATLQVRMDAELKESVEILYKNLGTSFAEAVRIFARQSLTDQGMPFIITSERDSAFGILSQYGNTGMREREEGAFEKAMVDNYAKAH